VEKRPRKVVGKLWKFSAPGNFSAPPHNPSTASPQPCR